MDAIQRGQKIVAIKLWRERTGVGLAEAKDAVESLARSMGYEGVAFRAARVGDDAALRFRPGAPPRRRADV